MTRPAATAAALAALGALIAAAAAAAVTALPPHRAEPPPLVSCTACPSPQPRPSNPGRLDPLAPTAPPRPDHRQET